MTKHVPSFELGRDRLHGLTSWEDGVSAGSVSDGKRPSASCSQPGGSSIATTSSSATTARARLPQLPPEIWTTIASHLAGNPDDLCWLWLHLRRVSRSFNAVIETAVANRILRSAEIAFPVHRRSIIRSDNPHLVMGAQLGTVVARFDRLSDDGERVFFRDRDALDRMGAGLLDPSVRAWRRRTEAYLADAGTDGEAGDFADYDAGPLLQRFNFDQPPHVITMGGMVNDTELWGLQVDCDRLELSFDWKHTLSSFLGEEERVKSLENAATISQHSLLEDMRARLHAGRVDLEDAFRAGVSMGRMQEQVHQIRRKVRCYRFRHGHQRTGRPISLSSSLGQPGRVEEHLRLAYMRSIRDGGSIE